MKGARAPRGMAASGAGAGGIHGEPGTSCRAENKGVIRKHTDGIMSRGHKSQLKKHPVAT